MSECIIERSTNTQAIDEDGKEVQWCWCGGGGDLGEEREGAAEESEGYNTCSENV